ncbi:MAG: DNA alkylation repair protein [Bdellovibrio sp. CG10_big_fil_rev_8_21_14_0_10_47_8]|nr:MAG: DNA alkylation repair protein [Bdellovibrio sp. CG10_big_fil_rev_8_21_14_0_10_47_8]
MEPFKNLLNLKAAEKISQALGRASPQFDQQAFLQDLETELNPLELKQRVLLLRSRLDLALPKSPQSSFPILMRALQQDKTDNVGLSGFLVWPLTQFVMDNGLNDFEISMRALHAMTQVFTAEFAIRPFLVQYEEKTLEKLMLWTQDDSEHVRRLSSEGSRPLLPWGQKLSSFVKSPEKTWPLLEALKEDSSKYVQKSVANHLNDHSKNHQEWLIKNLKKWKSENRDQASVDWIIRHGTRSLIKRGHPGALALQGVRAIDFKKLKIKVTPDQMKLGGSLTIDLTIQNPTGKKILVIADVEILLLKSNGQHQPKVFKGKKFPLMAHETLSTKINIPLKKVTTRRYYPGKQGCRLLLNGIHQKTKWFNLSV